MNRGNIARVHTIPFKSLRKQALAMGVGETLECATETRANYLANYLRGRGFKASVFHTKDGTYYMTRRT